MFSPYEDTKLTKSFRLNLDKIAKGVAEDFARQAKKNVNIWGRTVYKLLSKKVSASIIKSKRRRPDDNPLPHYNTGTLRSSLDYYVHANTTAKNNFSVSMYASIGEVNGSILKSAYGTNAGYKPRKDGTIPSWYGWMDNIMQPLIKGKNEFKIADPFDISTTIKGTNIGEFQMVSMYDIIDDFINMRMDIAKYGGFK
jgi:hypothetical protein